MKMSQVRRGVILPVVLFVLLLLGLLVAMFSFRVNADLASTRAIAYRLQTRLAAEAGVERVKLLLRESRYDMDRWYHNPDELHRIIVWMEDGDETLWGTNEEFEDELMVYRFSIVADDPTDDEEYIRFGITDEASKVNLNTATEWQLRMLVRAAVAGDEEIDPQEIVDAILDWRDVDRVPRGADGDTEGEYYRTLPKPYLVKNGPFDTVEELLLVKGVTGQILYGEDFDRNGLLTANEDDGDETFPRGDNQDGVLNRGLYPYLTVLSAEDNVSNDNRPRVYLLGDEATARAELSLAFPDEPGVVDFIVGAARGQEGSGDKGGGGKGSGGEGSGGEGSGGKGSGGEGSGGKGSGGKGGGGEGSGGKGNKLERKGGKGEKGPGDTDTQPDGAEGGLDELGEGALSPDTGASDPTEMDDAGSGSKPIRTPASLFRAEGSPLTLEHLPVLMDRTTMVPPEQRTLIGLININTAPPLVLRCIEGLTGEHIGAILEVRDTLDPETKATTAWLLTEDVVDFETFEQIASQITARGQQFRIESLGYAGHIGMVTRLEVVVDMLGPIAETVYYRDLTYLGGHYPIREKDLENIRVR
ncbi:MAG: hypothetical protein WBE26_20345 [Phycisphaerae bacterium]